MNDIFPSRSLPFYPSRTALLCLSLLVAASLPGPLFAQDAKAPSPEAKAALDVITQGGSQAVPPSPAQPAMAGAVAQAATAQMPGRMTPGSQNASFVVQPGQTLDRIIRARLPQAPFKNELIRRAFMDLNPTAFPLGTPHLIPAGAVISVPTPEQIRQSALAQNPQLSPYFGSQDGDDEPTSKKKPKEDRRKWVRFP